MAWGAVPGRAKRRCLGGGRGGLPVCMGFGAAAAGRSLGEPRIAFRAPAWAMLCSGAAGRGALTALLLHGVAPYPAPWGRKAFAGRVFG
jgi:hypothetical protein